MKFNVTEIEFDFTDSQGSISFDEEIEARDLALGVWDADDEDDLLKRLQQHQVGVLNLLIMKYN